MHKILSAFIALCIVLGSRSPALAAEDEILIKYFDIADGRLAFTYEKNKQRTVLVLDLSALEAVPLVDLKGNNESPRFSPDGERILFVSDRNGKKELFVARSDGADAAKLNLGAAEAITPDWALDGKKIAFALNRGASGTEVYISNADGTGAQPLTNTHKQNKFPRWSPAGKEITFVTNEYWPGTDLLSYNLETKKITILTTGYASSFDPAYSRDGSQFVYVSGPKEDSDILLAKKGEKPSPVVARPGKDVSPEWFDNSAKLWFLGETPPGSGHFEIYLHDMATKEDIQLTQSPGLILDLSWTPHSPNAKKVSNPSAVTPEPKGTEMPEGSVGTSSSENLNTLTPEVK